MTMTEQEMLWLVKQLIGTAEVLGQALSPAAAALMAEDLSSFPQLVLARALSRVRNEHAGRLTPKEILDRIDDAVGRPAANEAWAIASTALDERATVVWTNEMAAAWSLARPVAEAGDMIGARMAFITAYERVVRGAREAKAVPTVTVSIGWDAEGRNPAIEKALQLGYITPERAAQEMNIALPPPVFNPLALLTDRVDETPGAGLTPELRARLKSLRDDLANRRSRTGAAERLERIKQARYKRELNQRVQQRLAEERKA
jgi:hypothetical protein